MSSRIKVDISSQTPVYKQLINNIEENVRDGALKEGDLLPSMNELSASLDISKEAVKNAYSSLRDYGVIEAIQGKGFYVASNDTGRNPKILMLFDKLSTYKYVLFSSFSSAIGNSGEILIRLHDQQVDLFEYYINEYVDLYDYYVITPHFPLDPAIQKRVIKAIKRIPNRKLVLLDRNLDDAAMLEVLGT